MRRVMIVVIALAMLAGFTGIAGAEPGGTPGPDKPTTTTTAPETEKCAFDGNGVLEGWPGESSEPFVCQWHLPSGGTFRLHIEGTVLRPYLAVKDAYLPQGNICFREVLNGWQSDVTFEGINLPANGECPGDPEYGEDDWGDEFYALMVSARVAKGTTAACA